VTNKSYCDKQVILENATFKYIIVYWYNSIEGNHPKGKVSKAQILRAEANKMESEYKANQRSWAMTLGQQVAKEMGIRTRFLNENLIDCLEEYSRGSE
jgi:hypothetical protein